MSEGFQDPYMDLGATVLRNKLGITDRYELSLSEEMFARLRSQELAAKGVTGSFDLEHFKSIHQYLFQDVYEWAGEPRIIDISKGGTIFEKCTRIAAATDGIQRSLESENYLKDLSRPEFAKRLASYYKMWNAVHPFREGNGRSTRMMMGQLAANAGWMLDVQRIENIDGQWNEASKRSFNGDLSMVTEVLLHAVRDPRAVLFERADREVALRIYPDLEAAYQTLDAVKDAAMKVGLKDKTLDVFLKATVLELGKRLDDGVRTFDPQQVARPSLSPVKAVVPKIRI